MVPLTKLQQERCIPWAQIIFNCLTTMTQTKAVVPTMSINIWRLLKYTRVRMWIFSVNFSLEQFNCMLSVESTEGLPEKDCPLIEKHTMPKKLNGKIALIIVIPVVRPPCPTNQGSKKTTTSTTVEESHPSEPSSSDHSMTSPTIPFSVTNANLPMAIPHKRPRQTQPTSREITRGP